MNATANTSTMAITKIVRRISTAEARETLGRILAHAVRTGRLLKTEKRRWAPPP